MNANERNIFAQINWKDIHLNDIANLYQRFKTILNEEALLKKHDNKFDNIKFNRKEAFLAKKP